MGLPLEQLPLLQTKLHIPRVRPEMVSRPRLLERLNAGPDRKLTLISAPAGFGKTTLLSEWVHQVGAQRNLPSHAPQVAWLSLGKADSDPARFLAYMLAALRTLTLSDAEGTRGRRGSASPIGKGMMRALRSPQAPPAEAVLTTLINEISAVPGSIVLVLDDYHTIDSPPVDRALGFLLERLPSQMHLVIATREDPALPLARLRARGQLTELRAADLRFTPPEAAEFLNQGTDLGLSAEEIAALENRTEGWIAGLQLASLALQGSVSMQGRQDTTDLVKSFTGSHRYVLDYLVEEVLAQQSGTVQTFLLQTAILDHLCGPLCDAVRFGIADAPSAPTKDAVRPGSAKLHEKDRSQEILEALERANLFIVPLDDERRWYRYHHLFADLLRQRLRQSAACSPGNGGNGEAELHTRASMWYEQSGLEIEAFRHAAAAGDVDRAARLIEGKGMPLTFRGALVPVLNWLESLPASVLDATPLLWVTYASAILASGQVTGVEEKLQAAEAALQVHISSGAEGPDPHTRDLIGRIAATRATIAWGQNDVITILAQSRRALEYLHPDNLPFRTSTAWKMGRAYFLQGDRAAAHQALTETIAICQTSRNTFIDILASGDLASVQLAENQLHQATATYRRILELAGDPPLLAACGAYLGLGRILYEWNDPEASLQHGLRSIQLAEHVHTSDAYAACGALLARLRLVAGDLAGATAALDEADRFMDRHGFVHRLPELASTRVLVLLHQDRLEEAARLAQEHQLPISQGRVHLALGETGKALALLEPVRRQAEAKSLADQRLRVMVLQAVALQVRGESEEALHVLADALVLAEPGGFVRTFVDAGPPMEHLLQHAATRGLMPKYTAKLLAAFGEPTKDQRPVLNPSKGQGRKDREADSIARPMPASAPSLVIRPSSRARGGAEALVEELSARETEVLQLVADGLTNREIANRLYLSMNTVKAHTRNIYGKLGVHSRTQAVARAQELGLLLPR